MGNVPSTDYADTESEVEDGSIIDDQDIFSDDDSDGTVDADSESLNSSVADSLELKPYPDSPHSSQGGTDYKEDHSIQEVNLDGEEDNEHPLALVDSNLPTIDVHTQQSHLVDDVAEVVSLAAVSDGTGSHAESNKEMTDGKTVEHDSTGLYAETVIPYELPGHQDSILSSQLGKEMPRHRGIEFYVIRHAESTNNVAHLISGRSHSASLTSKGQQQAQSLGRFFREYLKLRFDYVYSSTLGRAQETAEIVCQELFFPVHSILLDDRLQELSQGEWEGRPRNAIYTAKVIEQMNANQPDFRAPGGESQRQVESRMMSSVFDAIDNALKGEKDGRWGQRDMDHTQSDGLQTFPEWVSESTSNGTTHFNSQNEMAAWREDLSPIRIAVFSHATAIKCLLRGILHSSPNMTHRIEINNTAVTVLKYNPSQGWQLCRMNDTNHLVLANAQIYHGT